MPGPFTQEILKWGRAVKSWATGLDYVNTDFPAQPPAPGTTIPAGAPWALPHMERVQVPPAIGTTSPVWIPGAVALTREQFFDRLQALNIGDANVPSSVKTVVIVQGDDQTWMFRLPARVHLQDSEQTLKTADYSIPWFYDPLYAPPGGTPHRPRSPSTYPEKMVLHANRIGEYTLNNCT